MRCSGALMAEFAFGGALGLFSTYWSIGFIMLVRLNYLVGQRIGVLVRI